MLACAYAAIAGLLIHFQAVWWIGLGLVIPTLPALYDAFADTRSGMTLDDTTLGWFSGRRSGTLALHEVDRMRFDTRWDFSVRITALLKNGKKIRLPYESMAPHRDLEQALTDRGVPVERHHFTVF